MEVHCEKHKLWQGFTLDVPGSNVGWQVSIHPSIQCLIKGFLMLFSKLLNLKKPLAIWLWKWKWRDIRPSMVTHTRNLCSAFNPSNVHTHSSEHTHTVNTHPEQWAAIYAAAHFLCAFLWISVCFNYTFLNSNWNSACYMNYTRRNSSSSIQMKFNFLNSILNDAQSFWWDTSLQKPQHVLLQQRLILL